MRRPFCEVVTDLLIRRRLEEAFDTLRRLPSKHWPQGYRLANGVGAADETSRGPIGRDYPRPTSLEVSEADEALAWLAHLRSESDQVRRAVQLRARGQSLREIAPQLQCSHVWVGRLEARGIAVIVAALRGLELLPSPSTMARLPDQPQRPPVVRTHRLQ